MKTTFTLLFSIMILVNSLIGQQQIQNAGFEQWEDAGTVEDEPVNWSSIKTSDDSYYNILAPVVWGKSTDAHSGNYSVSLFNVGSLVIASGTICNGRYHTQLPADSSYVFTDLADERWHSTLTERPDSVVGWFKCNPTENDFGTVKFLLHTGYAKIPGGDESTHIALAYFQLPSVEVSTWTRFSAPFVYNSSANPQYYLSILTSGNGVDATIGSTALFDDLEFIYNEIGIDELTVNNFNVYSENNSLKVEIEDYSQDVFSFALIDISGRTVYNNTLEGSRINSIDISQLHSGLYIATATNSDKTITKKILINK